MKTLVVGDIHGGLKALKQVLEKAAPQPADLVVFLGDYVDGWSEAAETIDFLIEYRTRQRSVMIRGNHDALSLEWLKDGRDNPLWLASGGQQTIDSYRAVGEKTRALHKTFFEELDNYYLDPGNRLYLHAGFTNQRGVEHEYFSGNFYWDRTLWETALSLNPSLRPGDVRYPPRLAHYREIFIGHTPVTRIGRDTPVQAANVWNVDTGAAFQGPLSVLDASSGTFWQSDPVYSLYPGETGRNPR